MKTNHSLIWVLSVMATSYNLKVEKIDFKTIFFHRDLEEEIWMEHLEGFKVASLN